MFSKKVLSLLLCTSLLISSSSIPSHSLEQNYSQEDFTMYQELLDKDYLSGEYTLDENLVKYSVDEENMVIEKQIIPLTKNIDDSEPLTFKYDIKNDIMEIDGHKIELTTTIHEYDPEIYNSEQEVIDSHNMDILNNFKQEIILQDMKSRGIDTFALDVNDFIPSNAPYVSTATIGKSFRFTSNQLSTVLGDISFFTNYLLLTSPVPKRELLAIISSIAGHASYAASKFPASISGE